MISLRFAASPLFILAALVIIASVGCGSGEQPAPTTTSGLNEDPASTNSPGTDPVDTESADADSTDAGPVAEQTTMPPEKTPPNRDQIIAAAERMEAQGNYDGAAAKLSEWLLVDPQDGETVFRYANLSARKGDLSAAIEILQSIPVDDPIAGLPALGQAADWCLALNRYDDAEASYLKILAVVPDAAVAHRKLAFLYNRQGRRHEAAEHVYALCRQGNVRQDELHSLIQLGDAMFDPPSEPSAEDGQPKYHPIGESGLARKLFMDERFGEAVELLRPAIEAGQQPPSILAFFGRCCAEAQDDASFQWWLGKTDPQTQNFSEYWAAVGTMLWSQGNPEMAARALLEALERDPKDFRSIVRLRAALKALGRDEEAEQWAERWKTLRDIAAVNNRIADSATPNSEAMDRIGELLESMGRTMESVLWRYLAGFYRRDAAESLQQLQLELRQLVEAGDGLPDQQTRLCGMKLDEYPLPPQQWMPQVSQTSIAALPEAKQPQPARFANIADAIGLDHAYHVAATDQDRGFSVYQSVGGAVAVLDYDLDGRSDLYFTQGGCDPPEFIGDESNVMYRNLARATGELPQLQPVTLPAHLETRRYSTGVTVGDWNQDGFADIVVANIGRNSLWINSGDGSFREVDFDTADDKTLLSTSLAMGDLTGDAIPDVFELNYLHDPELSKRPERNPQGQVVSTMMPADFNPGLDRVIRNDGRATPTFHPISDAENAANKGLGVILGDFDESPGNEVFVGNDTDPNQLWVRSADGSGWNDVAMLRGCAYAYDGVPTASMGVAAADFDGNGALDFHVTNFQDETVSLYLSEGKLYHDRNVRYQLAAPSDVVLGFGTQALDYDNDSRPDLFVANGHIEQAVTIPAPFKQPPQLFANLGRRFALTFPEDASGYLQGLHVGRGVARLDLNRDGKSDLAVTHLGETSALLLNQTESDNHWLQLQLIGTASERDAIGAKVDLHFGGRTLSQWVLAGDGFFAKNESTVSFGLGTETAIDSVQIRWPSGQQQTVTDLKSDQRWLVIEGQNQAFEWEP